MLFQAIATILYIMFSYLENSTYFKMKNRNIVIIVILLILAIGNFTRMSSSAIRTVDFLSVFAIGALTGVLMTLVFQKK